MKFYYTTLFILSVPLAAAQAAPPTITNISPRGLERGKPVEVVVTGTNLLPETSLILPFKADIKPLPEPKPNPAQARFQVTASAETPLGFFLVRVFTPEGVSAPAGLAVDPFPSVPEKEDNGTIEKAQLIPVPVVVDGQCAGGDVDYYRFDAKKGQRLVIETETARLGSAILPQLRLTDDKGRFVAADDTQHLRGDARLLVTLPRDGPYVLEISDTRYRGGNPPNYRLKIGDYDVAEEVFPLGFHESTASTFVWRGGNLDKDRPWEFLMKNEAPGRLGQKSFRLHPPKEWKEGMAWPEVLAGPYRHRPYRKPGGLKTEEETWPPPFTVTGRLEKPGEVHRFPLPVKDGQKLRFLVRAQPLGSKLDGLLKLFDDKGKLLVQADDVDMPAFAPGLAPFKSADPVLEFAVPKGLSSMEVELRDGLGRGGNNFGYLLTIEEANPDFLLRLQTTEINVPRAGFGLVPLAVTRRGYDGPILLECKNLPSGWRAQGGFIHAKASSGALLLQPPLPSPTLPGPLALTLTGKTLEGPPLETSAEVRFLLSKEVNPALATVMLDQLAVGLDQSTSFRLEAPVSLELLPGVTKSLSLGLTWAKEMKTPFPAVEVSIIGLGEGGKPLPGGVTIKPASFPTGSLKGDLILTAPATLPLGRNEIVLQAKAKIAGKDVTVVGPLVSLDMKAPFELVLEGKHLLKPGQPYVLKGSLKRHPEFKEAVQVKVDGLPTGVTAAPIKPIPGDQTTFQIELKTDLKASAVKQEITVTSSATLGAMAYAPLPLKLTLEVEKGK